MKTLDSIGEHGKHSQCFLLFCYQHGFSKPLFLALPPKKVFDCASHIGNEISQYFPRQSSNLEFLCYLSWKEHSFFNFDIQMKIYSFRIASIYFHEGRHHTETEQYKINHTIHIHFKSTAKQTITFELKHRKILLYRNIHTH